MSAAPAIAPSDAPKARISSKVRTAIRLMVDEGRSRRQAAEECGITDDWLYRALERPECRSYRNHLMQVFRESEASRTIARAAKLADDAESEHVRLQANTWLAGVEGISPVQKTENTNIHKGLTPGLTIVMGGWAGHQDDPRVIDGQAREAGSPHIINRIGQSSPHPEAGTAAESEPLPEKTQGRRRKTRGEK